MIGRLSQRYTNGTPDSAHRRADGVYIGFMFQAKYKEAMTRGLIRITVKKVDIVENEFNYTITNRFYH